MRKNFDNNLLYNQYSSLKLNNYYPIQNKISSKSPSNIFNYNRLNPSLMERPQSIKNSSNINIKNSIFSTKTNSALNLNTLENKISQSYTKNILQKSSSKLEINKNNNINTNYISPISLQKQTNLNTIKLYNINSANIDNHNFAPKKTLILDLDETLVHSRFREFNRKSDIVLNININDIRHIVYVLKRPNVDHFIKEMSKYYNIFIFTASISQYASPLIDKLDQGKLITGRLFRQHCIYNNGKYIKDIKQIGEDLKDIIIIDNNPISYYLNQDNGIPISTWYDDINDNELNKLIPLLIYLSKVNDVRTIIKQVLNGQKTKIDFNAVNSLINKKMTDNGEYRIYVNLNKELFDNKKYEYNINENNNDIIDSFSNMTIDEMQREEFSNNINENNRNININNNKNLYNNDVISSDNDNIFKRTNDIFNKMNHNPNNDLKENLNSNILPFKYIEIDSNKKNKTNKNRSFTPNINVQKKISYFNGNSSFKNNQKIDDLKKSINKNNNSNNVKINNFTCDKEKIDINSKKVLTKKREKINININNNAYNKIQTNIKKINNENEKNNINTMTNTNINSNLVINNINHRNNSSNNFRQGINYNELNKDINIKNNLNNINSKNSNFNNNNQLEIKQKQNNFKSSQNGNSINKDNSQKKKVNNSTINTTQSENNKKDNEKNIFELRREKLNEIKRKMEEITKDIMKSEDPLYQTQNNFMDFKKEINEEEENNNFSKYNEIEIQKRENNFMIKDNEAPNTFSRTFSGTKSFIPHERIFNNLSRYYTNLNENGINQANNLKQFNLNLNNNIHSENGKNSINKNEKNGSNQLNTELMNENINLGNLINDVKLKNYFKSHPFNFNKEFIEGNDTRKIIHSIMNNKSDSCNKNKNNNLFRNNNLNNYEVNTFNRNHNKININNYNLSNFNSFNSNTKNGIINIMNENKNINKLVIHKNNKSPLSVYPRNINNLN